MHEAKTNLSKIVNEVREGEVVYLAKAGKVVAELRAVDEKKRKPFPFGKYKGSMDISDDWDSDEVNAQISDAFYQEDIEDPNSTSEVNEQIHPKYKRYLK